MPETTTSPRPLGVGDQEQQHVGLALGREGLTVGQKPGLLPGLVDPEGVRPVAVGRAQVADKPDHQPVAELGTAGDQSRGCREHAAAVCAGRRTRRRARSRHRSPGRYSSPSKSSKSEPLGITLVRTAARGSSPRASSAIASVTAVTARGAAHDRSGHVALDRSLGAHAGPVVVAMGVRQPGVAEVGDPRRAGGGRDGLADQMGGVGWRAGEDHVDLSVSHDLDADGDGGCCPGQGLVGDQRALIQQSRLHGGAAQTGVISQGVGV